MAQELGHVAEVGASGEGGARPAVAEGVGIVPALNAGGICQAPEKLINAARLERRLFLSDEEGGRMDLRPVEEIGANGRDGARREKEKAELAFFEHDGLGPIEIEIIQREGAQATDAAGGIGEDADESIVAGR